jgi:hypothetical protein
VSSFPRAERSTSVLRRYTINRCNLALRLNVDFSGKGIMPTALANSEGYIRLAWGDLVSLQ